MAQGWGCSSLIPMASPHTWFLPDFVDRWLFDIVTPPSLPFPQSLSACLVCLQPAGICVREFFCGFTPLLFSSSQVRHEVLGTDLMHLNHLPVKQGFPLGIDHSGWLHRTRGRGRRLEHSTKGLQGFTGQGKAAHKECNDFCPAETLRKGFPA